MIYVYLLITVFVYLAFPFVYKNKTGGVPYEKAKKIALINAVSCFALFTVVFLIAGLQITASIHPAVLYYYIGKSILMSKEEKLKVKIEKLEKKYGIKLLKMEEGINND